MLVAPTAPSSSRSTPPGPRSGTPWPISVTRPRSRERLHETRPGRRARRAGSGRAVVPHRARSIGARRLGVTASDGTLRAQLAPRNVRDDTRHARGGSSGRRRGRAPRSVADRGRRAVCEEGAAQHRIDGPGERLEQERQRLVTGRRRERTVGRIGVRDRARRRRGDARRRSARYEEAWHAGAASRGVARASANRPPISVGTAGTRWMPWTHSAVSSSPVPSLGAWTITTSSASAARPASSAETASVDFPAPLAPRSNSARPSRTMAAPWRMKRPWRASSHVSGR